MNAKQIGETLKKLREDQEMTIEGLALLTDQAIQHVYAIERGDYNLTLKRLNKMCEALGAEVIIVPVDDPASQSREAWLDDKVQAQEGSPPADDGLDYSDI